MCFRSTYSITQHQHLSSKPVQIYPLLPVHHLDAGRGVNQVLLGPRQFEQAQLDIVISMDFAMEKKAGEILWTNSSTPPHEVFPKPRPTCELDVRHPYEDSHSHKLSHWIVAQWRIVS